MGGGSSGSIAGAGGGAEARSRAGAAGRLLPAQPRPAHLADGLLPVPRRADRAPRLVRLLLAAAGRGLVARALGRLHPHPRAAAVRGVGACVAAILLRGPAWLLRVRAAATAQCSSVSARPAVGNVPPG